MDETSPHVLLGGIRLKTLPSRLGVTELARLAADGARPAGPLPLPLAAGMAVELDRVVNAAGLVAWPVPRLVGYHLVAARHPAHGRHPDGRDQPRENPAANDGLPHTPGERHRLRRAHRASISPPAPAGPVTVQRRVSQRGSIMVASQKIQIGIIHARKIVTVTAEDDQFQLVIDGETIGVVPRTTTREVHRCKGQRTPGRAPRVPDTHSQETCPR